MKDQTEAAIRSVASIKKALGVSRESFLEFMKKRVAVPDGTRGAGKTGGAR